MMIEERSFGGSKGIRPKPIVKINKHVDSSEIIIVATAWGDSAEGERVVETIDQDLQSIQTSEATRVVDSMPSINDDLSRMRWALQKANDELVSRANSNRIQVLVEVAVLSIRPQLVSWLGLGHPSIFIRKSQTLHPVRVGTDWSLMSQHLPPLVSEGLGKEKLIFPSGGALIVSEVPEIILLSRSTIPESLFGNHVHDLDQAYKALTHETNAHSFWLSWIKPEKNS